MAKRRTTIALLSIVIVTAVLFIGIYGFSGKLTLPADVEQAMSHLPDKLDYNIHVKKILSDKCFSCHGPDSKKQEADLRLDIAEAAYSKITENGLKAIKPGNIAKSEVANRILSADADYRMPTPESHLALTAAEKAIILKWIDQGQPTNRTGRFVVASKDATAPGNQ